MNERTYSVDKNHLIGILEANREKHVAEFKLAVIAYRKKAAAALERRLAIVNEGKQKFDLAFGLPQPVNFVKQYDGIIGVLKMSLETKLLITFSEYKQYVLNEWSWDHAFTTNTKSYSDIASAIAEHVDDIADWSE